jgi:hypothetical protein
LRTDRDKLLSDVEHDLGVSTSKLSRLENGQGKVALTDIMALISYYGIQGTPLAEQLEGWVRAARQTGWWTSYDEVVGGSLDAHLAYEVDAVVERVYTIPFLPVLLQTPQYAEAVFRDMEHRPPREIRQMLAVRHRRQEALRRRDGLERLQLIAVTHETALHQIVGSPSVMRDQLDALLENSELENVQLRILPFDATPTQAMTCMWAHFQWDESGESDIVHFETPAGFFSLEDPEQVGDYLHAHNELMQASHNEQDSRELIRTVRDKMSRNS